MIARAESFVWALRSGVVRYESVEWMRAEDEAIFNEWVDKFDTLWDEPELAPYFAAGVSDISLARRMSSEGVDPDLSSSVS
jgi:hypothetical protein